jgi:2-polyprenyl-6-methoxyphenol hydroxylase-like FAD-dependent oxidoreductase
LDWSGCTLFVFHYQKWTRLLLGFNAQSELSICLGHRKLLTVEFQDDADIEESWSFPGKLEDVYKVIEGWDPICKAIVEKTPAIVDWKLVYRDPLPRWVSEHGRIALLGDSAHPFLPTSAQGATQAMEDGVVLAVCLKRGGKNGVPASVRAYQDIRYERVCAVQKTGETTRDLWHKADWEKVAKDPASIQMPREDWIFRFDAERNAEEFFSKIVEVN